MNPIQYGVTKENQIKNEEKLITFNVIQSGSRKGSQSSLFL